MYHPPIREGNIMTSVLLKIGKCRLKEYINITKENENVIPVTKENNLPGY